MRSLRRFAIAALALTPAIVGARGPESPSVWDLSAGATLRVWVQPSPHSSTVSHRTQSVRRAVAEWNKQQLPVRLRLGADSATANVRVLWTDRFDEPISGRTTCTHDDARRIVSAQVVLALKHSDGRVLSDEEMRVLALHELGHAIGLDHSKDPSSVMRPTVRVRSISAADRAHAAALYQR